MGEAEQDADEQAVAGVSDLSPCRSCRFLLQGVGCGLAARALVKRVTSRTGRVGSATLNGAACGPKTCGAAARVVNAIAEATNGREPSLVKRRRGRPGARVWSSCSAGILELHAAVRR